MKNNLFSKVKNFIKKVIFLEFLTFFILFIITLFLQQNFNLTNLVNNFILSTCILVFGRLIFKDLSMHFADIQQCLINTFFVLLSYTFIFTIFNFYFAFFVVVVLTILTINFNSIKNSEKYIFLDKLKKVENFILYKKNNCKLLEHCNKEFILKEIEKINLTDFEKELILLKLRGLKEKEILLHFEITKNIYLSNRTIQKNFKKAIEKINNYEKNL